MILDYQVRPWPMGGAMEYFSVIGAWSDIDISPIVADFMYESARVEAKKNLFLTMMHVRGRRVCISCL